MTTKVRHANDEKLLIFLYIPKCMYYVCASRLGAVFTLHQVKVFLSIMFMVSLILILFKMLWSVNIKQIKMFNQLNCTKNNLFYHSSRRTTLLSFQLQHDSHNKTSLIRKSNSKQRQSSRWSSWASW
jgi:uncharacterized membrane protein YfcA